MTTTAYIEDKYSVKLKAEQAELIDGIAAGRDAIGVLPTGYGKSYVFYFLPALLKKMKKPAFTVLVACPLLSLMRDQSARMKSMGIVSAVAYSPAEMTDQEKEALKDTEVEVVLATPEFLAEHIDLIGQRIAAFVVDEAHCVVTWGRSFRSSYLNLERILSFLSSKTPTVALTATLTEEILIEVSKELRLTDPLIVARVPDRPNIFIRVDASRGRYCDKLTFLKDTLACGGRAVIYMSAIYGLTNMWGEFCEGLPNEELFVGGQRASNMRRVELYHSATPAAKKRQIEDEMSKPAGLVKILFATQAFGLGVHVPNLRHVVILGVPEDPLMLWQLAGRAGRDGEPATVHWLYKRGEVFSKKKRVDNNMQKLVTTDDCWRVKILRNFTHTEEGRAEVEMISSRHTAPCDSKSTCCLWHTANCKCPADPLHTWDLKRSGKKVKGTKDNIESDDMESEASNEPEIDTDHSSEYQEVSD